MFQFILGGWRRRHLGMRSASRNLASWFRPELEALEGRVVPTTAWLDGTTLRVMGTEVGETLNVESGAKGDSIVVVEIARNQTRTRIEIDTSKGPKGAVSANQVQMIVVDGGAGDDTLTVSAIKPAILIGGGGKDTLIGARTRTAFVTFGGDTISTPSGASPLYEYQTDDNSQTTGEVADALKLVPYWRLDAIAIESGNWNDTATWLGGQVPAAGANVLIPSSITTARGKTKPVHVEVTPWTTALNTIIAATKALETVRIDGTLTISGIGNGRASVLTSDTVVVSPEGVFEMHATEPGTRATLKFQNDSDLVVGDKKRDPLSLSQGLIVLGTADIRGEEKAPYLMPYTNWLSAGATRVVVEAGYWTDGSANWQVGDRLVIPASTIESKTPKYGGVNQYNTEANNEVVSITKITPDASGGRYVIDFELVGKPGAGLATYHQLLMPLPNDDRGLRVPITNLTRSAVIKSIGDLRNAMGGLKTDELGHTIFMHTNDVAIAFAAFEDLGRTDKSEPVTDDLDLQLADRNQRGRYALHFHHAKPDHDTAHKEVDCLCCTAIPLGVMPEPPLGYGLDDHPPVQVVGSVVSGGPGWGFVSHDSLVRFDGNVAHDVNGAGFVAEDGDEVGDFTRNIAIGITTTATKEIEIKDKIGQTITKDLPVTRLSGRKERADFAFTGDGFWFQSPKVRADGNYALGVEGNGYVFFTFNSPRVVQLEGYQLEIVPSGNPMPSVAPAGVGPTVFLRKVLDQTNPRRLLQLDVKVFDGTGAVIVDTSFSAANAIGILELKQQYDDAGANLRERIAGRIVEDVFNNEVNTGRIEQFTNNVAVAVDKGLSIWKHRMPTNLTLHAVDDPSLISNLTVLNAAHDGIELSYVSQVTFNGVTLNNTEDQKKLNGDTTYGFGLVDVNAMHDIIYRNLNVQGFDVGLYAVPTGKVRVGDVGDPVSVFKNETDLVISTDRGGFNFVALDQWTGLQTFVISNVQLLGDRAVRLQAGSLPLDPFAVTQDGESPNLPSGVSHDAFQHLFAETKIILRNVTVLNHTLSGQLFFNNQANDNKAVTATLPEVKAALKKMGIEKGDDRYQEDMAMYMQYKDKTNLELSKRYGVAYGGYRLDATTQTLLRATRDNLSSLDAITGGFFLTEDQVDDWAVRVE